MRLRGLIAAVLLASLSACAPPPAPTEPPFTGLWTGPLPVSSTAMRTFAVQLHERAELRLMGYLLGGTSRRTLLGGLRTGDRALLIFQMKDEGLAGTIMLSGIVSGDTLTGEATVGSVSYPVTWTRSTGALTERNFVFAPSMGGEDLIELAIVQDGAGALVAGNFTGGDCSFMACGGGVTAFAESPAGAVTIGLASDGACSGAGAIIATFDASERQYDGSWTHTDAGGCGSATTSGTLIGGRGTGTRSDHVASVFASLGQLADDLEAGAMFAAPYAPVSSAYLHFGETAPAFLAARNDEVTAHPGLWVNFYNFEAVRTVVPAHLHPAMSPTTVVTFSDTRGDPAWTYREVTADTPGESGLRYIREESGAWRLYGNQAGEFDLPFAYTIGAERLLVPTGSTGQVLHLSLGGWGAHFPPLTGHLEGNAKADMMAQYAGSAAELTELANGAGGAPGVCDTALVWSGAGEICGVNGGPTGELIRARIFTYRAPYAGVVRRIVYSERPRPASAPQTHYFDNVPHWNVEVTFEGGLNIRFGHLGQLVGAVRAGLIAETGIDPDTYSPPSDPSDPKYCAPSPARCEVDLLDEEDAFTIAAHAEIARAQTDAAPIPGHTGYYRAQLGPSIPPWSQVEFFMNEQMPNQSPDVCVYRYLTTARRTALAAVMTADMLNPQSLRYAANAWVRPWKFRAEAELCNNDGYLFRNESDFSSIHSQLGGWFERAAGGTPNEQFAIARIHRSATAYDATMYDVVPGTTEPVEHLAARTRTDGLPFNWTVPGAGSVEVFYPAGDVLELTASSFTVKWREIGPASLVLYQRAAYELDADGLKIKWGALATTLVAAPLPALAPGEPCNDTTTICYNHTRPPSLP